MTVSVTGGEFLYFDTVRVFNCLRVGMGFIFEEVRVLKPDFGVTSNYPYGTAPTPLLPACLFEKTESFLSCPLFLYPRLAKCVCRVDRSSKVSQNVSPTKIAVATVAISETALICLIIDREWDDRQEGVAVPCCGFPLPCRMTHVP